MKLRAIIVDDEPLARDLLQAVIADDTDVEIVAMCASGDEALKAAETLRPDLIFLDIEMPEMTGLEIAQTLIERMGISAMPQIIFTTAYDRYAVDAFKVNAIDYVLKPIDDDTISASINRVRRILQTGQAEARTRDLQENAVEPQLKLQDGEKIVLIPFDDVLHVQAQGDYVAIHTAAGMRLIRSALKNIETCLPPRQFRRVHRSSIINLKAVREVIPAPKSTAVLLLSDGSRVPVSRSYTQALRQSLTQ